jgi:hypothetical protein
MEHGQHRIDHRGATVHRRHPGQTCAALLARLRCVSGTLRKSSRAAAGVLDQCDIRCHLGRKMWSSTVEK